MDLCQVKQCLRHHTRTRLFLVIMAGRAWWLPHSWPTLDGMYEQCTNSNVEDVLIKDEYAYTNWDVNLK